MNRNGITFFLTLMIGICVIILGLALAPAINEVTDDTRNTTTLDGAPGLDCNNASISDSQSAGCYAVDISSATIVGYIIALGLAIMVGKVIAG